MVYNDTYLFSNMDVDDYNMDIIPLEISYKDELRVYAIQIVCWSLYL